MTDYVLSQTGTQIHSAITKVLAVPGTALGSEYFIDVRTYGATGDGVIDDTASIQAAINACQGRGGGIVFFPPGAFKFTTLAVTASHVTLQGSGYYATRLVKTTATGIGIAVGVSEYGMEGFRFTGIALIPAVRQTQGAHIYIVNVSHSYLDHFKISDSYIAIQIESTVGCADIRIRDFQIVQENLPNTSFTGVLIGTSPGGANLPNDIWIEHGLILVQQYGIYCKKVGALYVNDVDIIWSVAQGICLAPDDGQLISNAVFTNMCCDSGLSDGVLLTGAGGIGNLSFTNCWLGTNARHGIYINNPNANGVGVFDCQITNNGEDGVFVSQGVNITINDNFIFDNSQNTYNGFHGILMNGVSGFTLSGNAIGHGGTIAILGNACKHQTGITIGAGSNHYIIANNRLVENVNSGLNDLANGADKSVTGNLIY